MELTVSDLSFRLVVVVVCPRFVNSVFENFFKITFDGLVTSLSYDLRIYLGCAASNFSLSGGLSC